jgi:hypothetical protein
MSYLKITEKRHDRANQSVRQVKFMGKAQKNPFWGAFFLKSRRVFMKNLTKLIGIIAILAAIGFSMAACGGDDGGSSSKTLKYTGVNGENLDVYELKIKSNSSSPKTGDAYVLTFYAEGGGDENGGKESSGTITVDGTTFTLSKGTSLTVTISEDGSFTAIAGKITFNDDSVTEELDATLTPVKNGGDGTLNGTWKKDSETVKFSGSSFNYTGGNIKAPGTATYGGGILVTQGTYGGDKWLVAGKYTVDSTKITFTGFPDGFSIEFSGDWIKQ